MMRAATKPFAKCSRKYFNILASCRRSHRPGLPTKIMKNDDYISPSLKPAITPARKHFDLTRLLVLRDRLPWFWFAFTVAVLVLVSH